MDEEAQTQREVQAAFERAHLPVRTFTDGKTAVVAEKPDVIVMELALSGPLGRKESSARSGSR